MMSFISRHLITIWPPGQATIGARYCPLCCELLLVLLDDSDPPGGDLGMGPVGRAELLLDGEEERALDALAGGESVEHVE